MNPNSNYILCTFDPLPTVSGLILPERYLIQEGDKDGELDAYGIVTDRRLINPQIINVLSGPYSGYKAFVYYGAYEIRVPVEDGTCLIPMRTLYFLIKEKRVSLPDTTDKNHFTQWYAEKKEITMFPGFYLGEEVFTQGEQTESGIFITPYAEKKEGVKIKLTNVCDNDQYKVGDTVITVDPYQYTLTFEGKKYVKLTEENIIGIERDGEIIPTNNTALIEYLPDPELAERIAENDKRRAQVDFINKMGLHYSDAHAKGEDASLHEVAEPPTISAKLIRYSANTCKPIIVDGVEMRGPRHISTKTGANVGDALLVLRNFGCVLPNGQWIVNIDTILARM